MNATFHHCPTCGNPKKGDRVYRCSKCGALVCDSCSPTHCCRCDQPLRWNDQKGWIE